MEVCSSGVEGKEDLAKPDSQHGDRAGPYDWLRVQGFGLGTGSQKKNIWHGPNPGPCTHASQRFHPEVSMQAGWCFKAGTP